MFPFALKHRIWIRAFAGTALLGAACSDLRGDMRLRTMLEIVEENDLAFTGTVMVTGEENVTVAVGEILSGTLSGTSVSVTPTTYGHCTGRSPNFTASERVLIFGKAVAGNQVAVAEDGRGKYTLQREVKSEIIAAAKEFLAVKPLKEHEKNLVMLKLIRSPNRSINGSARQYVRNHIASGRLRERYQKELDVLIDDPDPGVQVVGLHVMEAGRTPNAIPRMVELAGSEDLEVVSAAVSALASYETPEALAALVALTRHADPGVRRDACRALEMSESPEATAVSQRLLDDKDPGVRVAALLGLGVRLERGSAAGAIPRLVEMLDDPEPKVRASAAGALGKYRDAALIPPLANALGKNLQDKEVKHSIVVALYSHFSKGDAKARETLEGHSDPVVAVLKAGDPYDHASSLAVSILAPSSSAKAREALEWAAQSHPNPEIRKDARKSLEK